MPQLLAGSAEALKAEVISIVTRKGGYNRPVNLCPSTVLNRSHISIEMIVGICFVFCDSPRFESLNVVDVPGEELNTNESPGSPMFYEYACSEFVSLVLYLSVSLSLSLPLSLPFSSICSFGRSALAETFVVKGAR